MEILGASFSLLVVLLRDLCVVKKKKRYPVVVRDEKVGGASSELVL